MDRFEDEGYDDDLLFAFTYDNPSDMGTGANEDNAEELEDWVDYVLP